MSAPALLDLPTPRRPLPQIFDRLVVILAVQAHLYAVVLIAQFLPDYRSIPACLAVWLLSCAVPLACVAVARRAGGALSTRAFLIAAGLLLVVDIAMSALVTPADRGGPAVWSWGIVGVTLLTFAAFRPARDVLILAGGHSLIAVGVTSMAFGQPGVGAFRLLLVANAAATPALAAAQYLNLYAGAIRLREQAVTTRTEVETRNAANRAVQEDATGRLQALQAEVIPLLADIANGSAEVDDQQVARTARRLAGSLRRELVEARSGSWLLPASPAAASADGSGERWPGIVLLDPHRLLARLCDSDRAGLIALLDMLRIHSGWQRVSLALTPHDGCTRSDDGSAEEPTDDPSSAALTVVATGIPAAAAAQDADVIAAASRLGAAVEADSATVLVADALLALGPSSLIAPREQPRFVPDSEAWQDKQNCPGTR
jgi:hypothetical protein